VNAWIELCPSEQRIVKWIAANRSLANRNGNVSNGRIGPQSDEVTDLNGFGAELAFCKIFNCYPDFSISTRSGSSDCELRGETVDVKTTTYASGKLLAVIGKRELASDFYALMICDFPKFRFCGFAHKSELLAEGKLTDLGHGPTYAMAQDELRECPF